MKLSKVVKLAKKNNKLTSNEALGNLVGVTGVTVMRWGKNISFPEIPHAHKLAALAGLDPAQVITDVLIQAEKEPEVKTTLERIKRTLAAAAGVIPALLITVQYCILC